MDNTGRQRSYWSGRRVSNDGYDAVSFLGDGSENGVSIGFVTPPLRGITPVTFVFITTSSRRRKSPQTQPHSLPHPPKTLPTSILFLHIKPWKTPSFSHFPPFLGWVDFECKNVKTKKSNLFFFKMGKLYWPPLRFLTITDTSM